MTRFGLLVLPVLTLTACVGGKDSGLEETNSPNDTQAMNLDADGDGVYEAAKPEYSFGLDFAVPL